MYGPPRVLRRTVVILAVGSAVGASCVLGAFCIGPVSLVDLVCPVVGATTLLVAGISAVLAHRQRVQWNRYERHCCIYCGYDLRSNVERCSECGKRVPGLRALHRDPNPPPQAPSD